MGSRGSWETVRCWSMTVAAARGRAHPVGRTTSGGDMRRVWVIVCALLLTAAATAPARAETTVRWGALSDPETFDPHGPDNLPAWAARRQVYEALTLTGPAQTIEPLLAESWRMLDAHTWEFRLRRGVRFQEGEPLTAEDVVFSLDRFLEEEPYYRAIYGPPGRVEAVDPLTVRITTVRPEPLLYAHLMWPLIASKTWAERHGVGPADWSGTKASYADRHADGTGPFTLERFEPGVEAVYRKNPTYWGAGRWPLGVDRLVRRPILDLDKGVDALLAGELDFLETVPGRRAGEVEAIPRLKVLSTPRLQIFMLGFAQASAELRSSSVKGRNPFADRRVRQAVYEAIDAGAVIAAYGGHTTPAGYLAPRRRPGWSEELDRRLPYDPAEARRLLAEAGYPQGFDVALD